MKLVLKFLLAVYVGWMTVGYFHYHLGVGFLLSLTICAVCGCLIGALDAMD